MRKSIGTAVLAVLLAMAGNTNADTNLVVNGNYESGDYSGWTLSGNTGNTYINDSNPYSGNYSAQLGALGSDDIMQQTIATIAGHVYEVDFWLDTNHTSPANDFAAIFDGDEGLHISDFSETNNNPEWIEDSFEITASGSSAVLEFDSRSDPGYIRLDDVSVVEVPEPQISVFLMMTVGGFSTRRRRPTAQWRNCISIPMGDQFI